MADEQLKLIVEVLTKSAGSLTDMQRQVQAMANQWAAANKLGKAGAEEHAKTLSKLRDEANKLGNDVRGILTPAMAAFGVTVFSASGAVAAITKSVDDFAQHARTLAGVSKITGIPKEAIESYEDAGRVIGISADAMDQGLVHFTRIQDQWHRLGRGPLADFFATQPPEIREWGLALRATKDPAEALQKAIAFIQNDRIPAVQRKLVAETFGLSDAFVKTNRNFLELQKLLEKDRQLKPQDWDKVVGEWIEAKARLENVWDDLSSHVGHAMAPAFTRIATDLRVWIIAHRVEIEQFAADVSKWLENINWREVKEDAEAVGKVFRDVVEDVTPFATALNKVVEATIGWNAAIKIFAGLYVASKISAILRPLAAIAALGSPPFWVLALLGLTGLYGERRKSEMRSEYEKAHPGRKLEELPGLTEEQKKNLKSYPGILMFDPKDLHPSSFSVVGGGPNPLLAGRGQGGVFPAEETLGGGGGASDAINVIATGTRKGVYDGMIDFYQYMKGDKSGGGGGLFSNAAFSPSGQGPGGTLPDLGGVSPFQIGKEALGAGEKPGHFSLADIKTVLTGDMAGPGGAVGDLGMEAGLGIDRSRWLKELEANPQLKFALFAHVLGENKDPRAIQALMEEAANRADLRAMTGGDRGFAGHGNLSYFQGYDPGAVKRFLPVLQKAYEKVFKEGSDISRGAVDNSSSWLAAKHQARGEFIDTREFHGEHFEIPGTRESGRGERATYGEFRRRQLDQIEKTRAAKAKAAAEAGKAEGDQQATRVPGLQFGGIVPATPGGKLVRVAEGGDDELIVPLKKIRESFGKELENIKVGERLFRLTQAENPQNAQAFMENVMNRAAARHHTLLQEMNNRKYYPGVSIRGVAPEDRAAMEAAKQTVLAGSNLIQFATGNASGKVGFGYGRGARDPFTYQDPRSGERYGVENRASDLTWAARTAGMLDAPGQRITGSANVRIALGGMPHPAAMARATEVPHHHNRGATPVAAD